MKIGLDYWNVCSHYPVYFRDLADCHLWLDEVHIISAIGKKRVGTVKAEVDKLNIPYTAVHEVVFNHPAQSPMLKTAKCLELGIDVFYDDRQDVCDCLNAAGIVAFKVPRIKGHDASDVEAELQ